MAQNGIDQLLLKLEDPAQLEAIVAQLSEVSAAPVINEAMLAQAQQQPAPGQQQVPQQQVPQQQALPQQAPPQGAIAGPNLGAAITGQNPILNPDVAKFLEQIKLRG